MLSEGGGANDIVLHFQRENNGGLIHGRHLKGVGGGRKTGEQLSSR